MEIEITSEFLYINSDFFGVYANLPLYLLIGIPAIIYSIKLMRKYD
jgi:hypothetical protein